MSFLAWAFGFGALAVGLPLLFHLIRRTPRGAQVFSSLMFLEASPPRLTRRSRLDELLLLLLRGTALLLVALAFMRPFFRESTVFDAVQAPARLVAVLLDTSASMQRALVWQDALQSVRSVLVETQANDDVALFAFDRNLRTVVDFAGESTLAKGGSKATAIREALGDLRPGWFETDLAGALIAAADSLQAANAQRAQPASLQIVLVSDLQRGAALDRLQAYAWPEDVHVDVRPVGRRNQANATARILPATTDQAPGAGQRVRISTDPGVAQNQFRLGWAQGKAAPLRTTPVVVASGGTQTVELARQPDELAADRLVLTGDEVDFDNEFYCVPLQTRLASVVYLGDDRADDPAGLLYYLARALVDTPLRRVEVEASPPDAPLLVQGAARPDLVFVAKPIGLDRARELQGFAASGGIVFVVLQDAEQAEGLQPLLGRIEVATPDSKATGPEYALLAELDFTHALLHSFASPQYNDFTKIRFWQTLPIAELGEGAHCIARFDNDRPALWEVPHGSGRVYCLAASWAPSASQLALSSKFVTLMNVLLDQARPGDQPENSLSVGDPLPALSSTGSETSADLTMTDPLGQRLGISDPSAGMPIAEQPGIYQIEGEGISLQVAVNIAANECNLNPLPLESLRAAGVTLGKQASRADQRQQWVRLKDAEFEGRQKIWKWLLLTAFLVLVAETALAGRRLRRGQSDHAQERSTL